MADAFDGKVEAAARERTEAERQAHEDDDADPIRPLPTTTMPSWTRSWSKRAKRRPAKPGEPQPYDRDTDPLLTLDLREVWEQITGDEPDAHHRVTCPSPQHEDRFPACSIREADWRCFACEANGSIIDLGEAVYGIEPRGGDFFRLRRELLAATGLEAAA